MIEKQRTEPFIADHSLIVGYAATIFNAAWKEAKKKKIKRSDRLMIEQGMSDLPACQGDIKEIMARFE